MKGTRRKGETMAMNLRLKLHKPYGRLATFVGRILNPVWRIRVGDSDLGWKVETAIQRRLFGSSSRESVIALPLGASMVVPEAYSAVNTMLYAKGEYEPETTHVFHQICQPGTSVVDVGAHLGYYTLLAASLVGQTGSVYAFEADPYYQGFLERSVAHNDFHQVTVTGKAVTELEGTVSFFPDHWSGGGSMMVRPLGPASLANVETTSLDDFFRRQGWPSIDLMKIDVEGAEAKVLEGMQELSNRNPDLKLVIEFNGRLLLEAGLGDGDYFTWLERLGFKYIQVIGEPRRVPVHQHVDLDLWSRRGYSANLFCAKDTMDAGG